VPAGDVLLRFANAAQRDLDDLDDARAAVVAALGRAGLLEAAATVSVFNGLVRVADGTGIPLDDGIVGYSADYRQRLGLDRFGGAVNTASTPRPGTAPDDEVDVRRLFG
jgi:hypothetical protein